MECAQKVRSSSLCCKKEELPRKCKSQYLPEKDFLQVKRANNCGKLSQCHWQIQKPLNTWIRFTQMKDTLTVMQLYILIWNKRHHLQACCHSAPTSKISAAASFKLLFTLKCTKWLVCREMTFTFVVFGWNFYPNLDGFLPTFIFISSFFPFPQVLSGQICQHTAHFIAKHLLP